jgi:hypothetical protein
MWFLSVLLLLLFQKVRITLGLQKMNLLINKVGEVKLAHLSIKDYLLSEQICHGVSSHFRISETISSHLHISNMLGLFAAV